MKTEPHISAEDAAMALSRRTFVQVLGAGLLVTISTTALGQGTRRSGRSARSRAVSTRIHIGRDGMVTVLTGKIEMGQGARAELTQAAAEELRLPADKVILIMGDTSLVPDDGLSAGSRTTPSTVPAVRQGAAAAREKLVQIAAVRWGVESSALQVRDGRIVHPGSNRGLRYAELADADEVSKAFQEPVASEVALTAVTEWKVLGTSVARPNAKDLLTGKHQFPSDIRRPGMLYGKVLRPPSYGAKLGSIDLSPAKELPGVVVVQDGEFVGVAAPTTFVARQALEAIARTATWKAEPHPPSKELFKYLTEHAQGGVPPNPFAAELTNAKQALRASYHVAYVQHAPMETRSALAEWGEGRLTVWTGTQNPFGYHSELVRAFQLPSEQVRVIVPDFGGGFGGKHTAEAAIEASRLAKAAGRPVMLKWTREEEFTWAYFRPAAVIQAEAGLDDKGKLQSWHFVNINAGSAALDTPYRAGKARSRSVGSRAPLRQGSYRALAANANNFARECFMDELALAAKADPLQFRLAHLENPRIRAVLETAARHFDWEGRRRQKAPGIGYGLACGTEKGSVVATCVEVAVDKNRSVIQVRHVCEAFECGPVLNPNNLLSQVQGCIIMAMGAALREEMRFEDGKMLNPFFRKYLVPRLEDVPSLDIHFVERPDLPMVGSGETPMIAVAPAIANAVYDAVGARIRQMPIRLSTET